MSDGNESFNFWTILELSGHDQRSSKQIVQWQITPFYGGIQVSRESAWGKHQIMLDNGLFCHKFF